MQTLLCVYARPSRNALRGCPQEQNPLFWPLLVFIFQVVNFKLKTSCCLMLGTGGRQVTAQLQLRPQHNTDAAASATATVKLYLCRFVRHMRMHQLRCEWCHRYSHAQVTFESQSPSASKNWIRGRRFSAETAVAPVACMYANFELDFELNFD